MPHPHEALTPEQRQGARLWLRKQLIDLAIMGIILFASAGTLSWWRGWAVWGFYLLSAGAQGLVLGSRHPSLLAERARLQKGTKRWDIVIATLAASWLPMATMCLAGLSVRHGWHPEMPLGWTVVGALGAVAGWALTVWAMAANAFFAATVRIQQDRGHTVVSTGPYALARHPGYVGAILFNLGHPLVLGSWWALVPSGLAAALFILRTALEDRTLQAELPGYDAYAQRVRWRLLPRVW